MQKRQVLWWLVLFALAVNMIVLLNMNVAIVSMVNKYGYGSKLNETKPTICPNTTLFMRNLYNVKQIPNNYGDRKGFDWTEAEQNMILSGFSWLSYFSILPGGIMAHKFGSKRVVGFGLSISATMSSLIPIFAVYGPVTVSWIRAIQGLLSVIAVPTALFTIIGNWSPPQERGKFGATFLVGASLGLTMGSFCFGYIAEYIHWKYVFHLTSVCGIIWTIFWYKLIYDSPQQHPTISLAEKEYIETSLKTSSVEMKVIIPWKSILTSVPVIICVFASNSSRWAFGMMNTYTPLYLKTIYGLDSNAIGILISIPLFLSGVLALGVGYCNDLIIKKGVSSMTNTRKLHAFFGTIVSSIPILIISCTKCNVHLVISCILFCLIIRACANFGPALATMDLSPKFCGVLEGLSGTSASIQAFIFSSAINYFTNILDIEELWKFTFLFTALYAILTNIVFLIFGMAEVQKWNFTDSDAVLEEKEPINLNLE